MRPLTLLDGGMSRELARLGAPFRQPEWSALALIETPDLVGAAHDAYIAAGAAVITSNTYAVVPFHIGQAAFETQGLTLADRAGRQARAAADRSERAVRVAGSLPPVCGSYRPDLFDPAEAGPVLATLVRGLAPHADLWLAETLSDVREAELVREVLGDDRRPLWLSFTLHDEAPEPGRSRLRSGQTVAEATEAAVRLGAAAILFNCSQPEVMGEAITAARTAAPALHLGVYANAFAPQPPDAQANDGLNEVRADLTPAGYLAFAKAWRALGADIVGGCCGIGPEHITALRAGLD